MRPNFLLMASLSFSSPHNWVYDVFPSFNGKDVRVTFLNHFLKELDQRLIIVFKDNTTRKQRNSDGHSDGK
ncbi:hypothetical protein F2Q69_00008497 [Brassica cretica]|uniref:TIR domain-containing protein n=1 Tax=Brassica cretica TaxID=69181 RepID=A0A8S9NU04_BRACR|nr:hypothetical protein F2Q69_00008497 [Brassica cretica]